MSRRAAPVAAVVKRHRNKLTRLEVAFARQNYLYSRDVSRAYQSGATSTPPAPQSLIKTARRWRSGVADVRSDLGEVRRGVPARTAALKTYADLDNAIYHTIKALAAGPDVAERRTKAARYLSSYTRRNTRLQRAIR